MSDRDAARRRRSAQNRREREAREARVARARSATTTPTATSGKGSGKSSGKGAKGRSAARTDRLTARSQRWTDSNSANPGARMVLLSALLAIAATIMLYFLPIVPVRDEVAGRTIDRTVSLAEETGPKVLPFLMVPVLLAGAAWFAGRWTGRRRRRVYVVAAVTLWLWILLVGTLGLLYLVSAVSLAVGAWQSVQAGRRDDAAQADGVVDEDDDLEDDEYEDEYDDDDGSTEGRTSPWSKAIGGLRRRPAG